MKKILFTGMNKLQCTKDFFLSQQLKVIPSHYSLIRCLEDMGYQVEQRPVSLGEDLSSYEEVIVYIHSIQAFCQFIWSGLYTIAARPNCIIAFDDWQFDQIISSIDAYLNGFDTNPENNYRQYLFDLWQGKEDKETVMKFQNSYKEACSIIMKGNNRLLMSAFSGGDISLMRLKWNKDKVYTYNPNPYHLNRKFENAYGEGEPSFFEERTSFEMKKREWNFASLVQLKTRKWLDQQKISWNINFYGSKRGKFKCERKTEPEMCKVFEEQWGCLMPGYFNSGSGWWRARPLQVADAESILIGEQKEMNVYYRDSYLSSLKASDIEAMDLTQLIQTTKAQKEALYSNHPLDKAIQREELNKVLGALK
jgi:hypothetical protein